MATTTTKKLERFSDKDLKKKIVPLVKKKFPDDPVKEKYVVASVLSRIHKKIGSVHASLPDYHKFGLPFSVAVDLDAWAHHLTLVMLHLSEEEQYEEQKETIPISDQHKTSVLEAFKETYNAKLLNEVVILPRMFPVMVAVLKPDTASHVVAGIALGFYADLAYHLVEALWGRIKDYIQGQSIEVDKLRLYAKDVAKHADKKTKIMIADLAVAMKKEDWIKASKIQRELIEYGRKVGLHEDGGGSGGGGMGVAPTNNVSSGHIAGANNDPPGPKAKLFKKGPVRRKLPIQQEASIKQITKVLIRKVNPYIRGDLKAAGVAKRHTAAMMKVAVKSVGHNENRIKLAKAARTTERNSKRLLRLSHGLHPFKEKKVLPFPTYREEPVLQQKIKKIKGIKVKVADDKDLKGK